MRAANVLAMPGCIGVTHTKVRDTTLGTRPSTHWTLSFEVVATKHPWGSLPLYTQKVLGVELQQMMWNSAALRLWISGGLEDLTRMEFDLCQGLLQVFARPTTS